MTATTYSSSEAEERNRRRTIAALAALVALALVVAMVSSVTSATWIDTTRNDDNAWATAKVSLTDNLTGTAMFAATEMLPGDEVTNSIIVTNDGSVPLDVRLYSENLVNSDGVEPLAPQLNVKIGTSLGGIEVFDGTLADLATAHTNYTNGTAVITLAAAGTQTYYFWVQLDVDAPSSVSGDSASIDFVWEGQTQ